MNSLSRATVARLPRYLRLVEDGNGCGSTVSSEELADAAGVTAANVRRDLAALGFQGTRGIGYSSSDLAERIRKELGIENRRKVGIIGAGNLGTALAGYSGLSKRGFDVVAVYDVDPKRVGDEISGTVIKSLETMGDDIEAGLFDMAILAVPATSAQSVSDILAEAGARSILNFAPVRVSVHEGVAVRQVDLSHELQVLSYYG